MRFFEALRPPPLLLGSFLAIMLALGAALSWLGWRLLEQDRSLESQRARERLEYAADRIVAELRGSLSELDDLVSALLAPSAPGFPVPKEPPEDVLLLVAGPQTVQAYPNGRLLYYPILPSPAEPDGRLFRTGEVLEYQQHDPVKAIAVFRRLAGSRDPSVRAGALVRLGRNLRKSGRFREALQVYSEMEKLSSAFVAGLPAELVAREARCSVLEETGQSAELEREARALYTDLQRGRWPLVRSAYEFHSEEARGWLGSASDGSHPLDALALAAAVEWLWGQRLESPSKGRRSMRIHDQPVLIVWASAGERLAAAIAGARYLESLLLEAVKAQGVHLALTDGEGRLLLGQLDDSTGLQVARTAAATKMPWTFHVASGEPGAEESEFAARRRLLLAGFAVMVLLLLAGTYFISRAMMRELAVARLQSDFVAAVSHEFRTPLTAVRQLSELLAKGRVPTEKQRQQSYELLAKESERLQRLVEGLLDFGRMEAGARHYHFEKLDVAELARDLAAQFQENVEPQGYHIEVSLEPDSAVIRGDREALGRAVWNLLDNAVKYSPDCQTVWIDVGRRGERLALHVRDQGLGIPIREQKEIFRKFVRGSSAEAGVVKGTGLGLAMVHEIVRAHGGEIQLQSEAGRGSTFTILLPVESRA